jgi:hypothetical protein
VNRIVIDRIVYQIDNETPATFDPAVKVLGLSKIGKRGKPLAGIYVTRRYPDGRIPAPQFCGFGR